MITLFWPTKYCKQSKEQAPSQSAEKFLLQSRAYGSDFENTWFFESFSSLKSIRNYFLTNVKKYLGIRTEIRK